MATLKDAKIGQTVRVEALGGNGALRQHFLDMGIIPGTEITLVKYAPMGDPVELRLHGYELTLRLDDAEQIKVSDVTVRNAVNKEKPRRDKTEHPGLGEGGKFHPKGSGTPLPDGTVMRFALVGNQNCGKTTLFNRLTGSRQHVGNFPGVTVDRKDGTITGHDDTLITDLPGIYSMSPYSSEEIVSRNFVLNEKPHAIINIIDVTNMERNLYLTMQLIEMNIPMVVALNMMDELSSNGGGIDVNKTEQMLGVPVVPISAAKNQGIEELVEHAVHIAYYQESPVRHDFCENSAYGDIMRQCMTDVAEKIKSEAESSGLPLRFAVNKVIEGDPLIIEQLGLAEEGNSEKCCEIENIIGKMENMRGLDRSAAIADMRFGFIKELCGEILTKPHESREHIRSRRIDRFLTGKYTAIPAFIGIMGLVFWLTFNVIGAFLQEKLENGIELITDAADKVLTNANVSAVLHDLVIDGIFEGVGSVLSFLPIIVTLFFFLSLLEDSGYIARVAFFMDKLLRKIGLSGRSIVPMLIGFGCSVPAVMATRTLPSERDRKMTILLTPFMSCTAKLPIYAFFVNAFFPAHGGLIMVGLYVLGVILGILAAYLYKGTIFRGEAVPFVMELPNYRLPGAKNVLQLLWEKAKDFLQKAFTVILIATICVWFLQNFDPGLHIADNAENSILAGIAGIFVPVMNPAGLGDWRIIVSLVSGFMAKESVVSTMNILFGENIRTAVTSLTAASMLVFSLLYTPCAAAVASIKRELGGKWAFALVVWQCAIAWLAAFTVRIVGLLLGVM